MQIKNVQFHCGDNTDDQCNHVWNLTTDCVMT